MKKFCGLNVSSKFAICGMPIRIDSYKTCNFGCKYCFANARKIMEFKKELQIADIGQIERRIKTSLLGGGNSLLDTLIRNGVTWHFGGMSDPFQPVNKELKITNQIVDITNRYDIHLLFSTKTDDIHDCNIRPNLHSFQMSVTNVENRTDIEPNVPDIDSRYKMYRYLKNNGFKVGIRIQPFIPNVSTLDIVKMFSDADHFILEGLKIVPQNEEQKQYVFEELNIPKSIFTQKGLLTMLPEYRLKMYEPFIDYFKKNGISYSISDNDLRYLGNNKCCCGDALIYKSSGFDTTNMIMDYGVGYSITDVLERIEQSGIGCCKCDFLFTSNRTNGCKTVYDFYKERFGKKLSPFSPKFQYRESAQLELWQ